MSTAYRNGTVPKGALKVDRPLSMNSSTKSSASFKSKTAGHTPVSGPRRKSTGSVGNSAVNIKDGTSGESTPNASLIISLNFLLFGGKCKRNKRLIC